MQLYRLYVVHTENHKNKKLQRKQQLHAARTKKQYRDVDRSENPDIYIISSGKYEHSRRPKRGYDDYDEAFEKKTRRKDRYVLRGLL